MTDVVVIGAGISGAACAWELASRGVRTTLVERWHPAAMGSGWSLAGVRQSGRHPAELPLARAAVDRWAALDEALGAKTFYRRQGNLRLARTAAEADVIERLVREQSAAGLDIEFLGDHDAIRAVAPAIGPAAIAGSLCRSDGHADAVASVQAFVAAARRHGAELRVGERVLAIEIAGGRVAGVTTDKGRIAAGAVVLAAGIFGNELLRPLGLEVPLALHMVTVLRSTPTTRRLDQVIGVANADCAGRQEVDGRWRATSGVEPWHGELIDGDAPRVPCAAEALAGTVSKFGALVPEFRAARIAEIWAGLIDLTPDALPVLDAPAAAPQGLVIGMGFSGHGFCLGPVTGAILADLATTGASEFPIAPFGLARFGAMRGSAEPVTLHG
ncbi:MAG: FAD-binding oxidoreductase [Alphaproteobacteria bacterium]|nr:FAD-binding oxidoreductase [Alphaproteobacteria bacterium]